MEGISTGDQIFATETMAELCARQGRTRDAVAIFRNLLVRSDSADPRRERWTARLEVLEREPPAAGDVREMPESATPNGSEQRSAPVPTPTSGAGLRLPLVVRQPVRAGQVVYARDTDLIVLASVNPGAELMADGNIHVYATLRGRAVAGAQGCREARIFCQRLEAELVGIDTGYLTRDDLPADRVGKAVQIVLEDGRCVISAL